MNCLLENNYSYRRLAANRVAELISSASDELSIKIHPEPLATSTNTPSAPTSVPIRDSVSSASGIVFKQLIPLPSQLKKDSQANKETDSTITFRSHSSPSFRSDGPAPRSHRPPSGRRPRPAPDVPPEASRVYALNFASSFVVAPVDKKVRFYPKKKTADVSEEEARERAREQRREEAAQRLAERKKKQAGDREVRECHT